MADVTVSANASTPKGTKATIDLGLKAGAVALGKVAATVAVDDPKPLSALFNEVGVQSGVTGQYLLFEQEVSFIASGGGETEDAEMLAETRKLWDRRRAKVPVYCA